jgi:phospholipid transport system substrate-binding protein
MAKVRNPRMFEATGLLKRLVALVAACAFSAAFAAATDPGQLVGETVRDVQQIIRQDPALQAGDQQRTLDLVEKKILPHFDFERMTMLAVGKDWERATPDQRERLVKAFRTLLVRTYSGALATYKDYKIDVKPTKGDTGDNTVVRTQVTGPGTSTPVVMEYRMHRTSSGWKVQDVAVEGVSLVTTYRTTFKSEIDRNGFDGLIKLIASKNGEPMRTSSSAPTQKPR